MERIIYVVSLPDMGGFISKLTLGSSIDDPAPINLEVTDDILSAHIAPSWDIAANIAEFLTTGLGLNAVALRMKVSVDVME